jgi:4-alpha-glucanotransferase
MISIPFRKRAQKSLTRLAGELGVQTSYVDALGETREASAESLRGALRAMGVEIGSPDDVKELLRKRDIDGWREPLARVTVAWEGQPAAVDVRLPAGAEWTFRVRLESGEELACRKVSQGRPKTVEGEKYLHRRIALGKRLPVGYHTVVAESGSTIHEASLFVAPQRCYSVPEARMWGVFAPVYALRSERNWGAGDLADLMEFDSMMREAGGDFVGTLPLLAAFLDEPFEPSPYAPVSRLFWNEFYLDIEALPEFAACERARTLASAPRLRQEIEELRSGAEVDYRRVMANKRKVLEALSEFFFGEGENGRRASYGEHLGESRDLAAYAKFRAAREGRDGDLAAVNYHLYVQWAMHEQMERFSNQARKNGPGLYLDYPLGVHPDGYDVAARPELFASGAAAGAPPDAFFTKGQNWGFPPMRPEAMREERFDYFRATIRQQLRYAGMLRLDHVMGLHRLFWVPEGAEASEGVYVRYPEEEMFAVLCIESQRHQSIIIGEDLGTVPDEVRSRMEAHGVRRMYVLQYELTPQRPVPEPPRTEAIASINTHDMPTFAGFWEGKDVGDRVELGLLEGNEAEKERADRALIREKLTEFYGERSLPDEPLTASLAFLAGSDAELVLVNLEDLWREETPQNVPGTSASERPNWQRKLRHDIRSAFGRDEVREKLRLVNERRKR